MSALTFVRRSLQIISQTRTLRSQPAIVASVRNTNRRRGGDEEDLQIVTGEVVEKKVWVPRHVNLLDDPKIMTLNVRNPVNTEVSDEQDANKNPKVGFSEDELALFDRITEIKVDDALEDHRKSKFNADFLDTLGPVVMPTFNVAALAEKNEVVRQLVDLNVSVYKWDKQPEIFRAMVKLNWHKECKPIIEFLVQKCDVELSNLSKILSRNPLLLTEPMESLEARLEYLRHPEKGLGLSEEQIKRIVSTEAFWLSTTIESLENRMNFFKNQFSLTAPEFKRLIVARPQIVRTSLRKIALKKFCMIEEMSFTQEQIKQAIMNAPKILTLSRGAVIDRFEVLKLDMGYDDNLIARDSTAMYCRASRLKERHLFLKYLRRDQYDPRKPGFISPAKVANGSDEYFVEQVAKSTKDKFEKFIKSL